jgi:hypothetical protein
MPHSFAHKKCAVREMEQGAPTYLAATGQSQQPFLGRWLLLTAAMFAASAIAHTTRLAIARRRTVTLDDHADGKA